MSNTNLVMNATLARPEVKLPDPVKVRARARQLFKQHRPMKTLRVVDIDQTTNAYNLRLHEEQDCPLHYTYVWNRQGNRGGNAPTRYAAALWDDCLTVATFEHWECAGLAIIDWDYDGDTDRDWYEDEVPPVKAHFDAMPVYYTQGKYRLSEEDDWEMADSCGGHMGYDDVADPFENEIVVEHMRGVNEKLAAFFSPDRFFADGI